VLYPSRGYNNHQGVRYPSRVYKHTNVDLARQKLREAKKLLSNYVPTLVDTRNCETAMQFNASTTQKTR